MTDSARVLLFLLIPIGLILAQVAFADLDPAIGVTASRSPFTDEAWGVLNARNFVVLGTWAPDDWHLYLVNLPFSLAEAVSFSLFGVGIVQARLVSIVAVGLTCLVLALGLRRAFGTLAAGVATIAFATCWAVLFNGRLALLEPMVAAFLTIGAIMALRASGTSAGRWGLAAGVALALAVGTKPNAGFAAVGILVGVVAASGWPDRDVRRWAFGAAASIALLAIGWVLLVGIPASPEVAADFRIWPAQTLPRSLGDLSRMITYWARSDGAVLMLAPIAIGGIIGAALALRRWTDLDANRRRLVGGAIGWLVAGIIPLLVLSYRPSRYAMPLAPAFAILLAAGISTLASSENLRSRRGMRAATLALALGLLSLPGLIAYAGWIRSGTGHLIAAQSKTERAVPAGAVVEGAYAPGFAMRAKVTTLVPWGHAGVNVGDTYRDRGVRWLVLAPDERPGWRTAHPDVWAARRQVFCSTYGPQEVCLYSLP